jgi:hypothetical protein
MVGRALSKRAKQMACRPAVNTTYQKAIDCKTLQEGGTRAKDLPKKPKRPLKPGLRETVQDDDKEEGDGEDGAPSH